MKMKIKTAADILMTAALPVLMCYSIVGETAHEVIGIAMFGLFILHHILNFGWIKSLFKSKYDLRRSVNTAVNALVFLCMKKAVKKTATEVKKQIAATAPSDTGAYAKSWATKTVSENSHTLEITVHSKNRYQLAHLLEKGHAKRGGGRVSGKPHIAPAEEMGDEMLENLIKKELS